LITVGLAAIAAAVLTSQFIFVVVALGAGVLLGTSLYTSRRPLTQALEHFRHQAVDVRVWGATLSGVVDGTLVVSSVNALGAGVHVFFDGPGGATHLKIAQPKDATFSTARVAIGSARYVQWNSTRLPSGNSAPALVIALSA
jgi:hypothetical protein